MTDKREAIFLDECGDEFAVPLSPDMPLGDLTNQYPECQFVTVRNVRDKAHFAAIYSQPDYDPDSDFSRDLI